MQNHMKEGMGTTVLKIDLIFLIFFLKLIDKHGSSGTVSLGAKKLQCRKTKYSLIVYDMLLLTSAAGTPTLFPWLQNLVSIQF